MVLVQILPPLQAESFLGRPGASLEQSLAESYAILLEQYVQVAFVIKVEISFSFGSIKLTRGVQCSRNVETVLARKDDDVRLKALQILPDLFQYFCVGNPIVVRKLGLDHGLHLILLYWGEQNARIFKV
jgi:hypothetical protein